MLLWLSDAADGHGGKQVRPVTVGHHRAHSPAHVSVKSQHTLGEFSVGAGIRGGAGEFPELRVRAAGYTRITTPQATSESNGEPVGADILRPTELRLTVP